MPASSILVNGQQTRRPGVYGMLDTSGLASGGALARGVVALVGEFEQLEPNVATVAATANALKRLLPDRGPQLASLLFAPSRDSRVPAGAQQVVLVRVDCARDPVAQGALTLPDATAAPSVTLSARQWGAGGNRITVAKAAGTVASTHKLTIVGDGITEVHDNLGGVTAFTVRYTGAEATTMTLLVNPVADPRVLVAYTKTGLGAGAYVPDKMAFAGAIGFTLAGGVAPVGDTTFTIAGTATDGSTSEVVTIAAGGNTATSVKLWTAVTSITPANLPGGGATWGLAGPAFSLARASYGTLQRVVDRINAKSAAGFAATVVTTLNPVTFDVADLDSRAPATDVVAAAAGPKHDVYSIVTALERDSDLVEADRATGATQPPATLGTTNLAGGSDGGTPASSDWGNSLDVLRSQFVNAVWLDSDDAAVHEQLRLHLVHMWGLGRDERLGYVGLPASTTKTNVKSKLAALNCQYLAAVAQEVQVYDPTGLATWLDPKYAALLAAAMKAGTAVGVPLTWKYPNVLDVRQDSTWNPVDAGEELLAAGLLFLGRDHLGQRWERSLTTYLQADNPILTELTAMESCGESIKDLRRHLEQVIGSANADVSAASLAGLASARLDRQKSRQDLGLIRDWRNLSVEDLGDAYDVSYEVAPIEPVNFVRFTAHAVRIPTTV